MGKAQDNGMSDSPADIRTAIADTRDELGQHLSVLGNQFFSPKGADGPKETTMPTEKRAKSPTQSGGKVAGFEQVRQGDGQGAESRQARREGHEEIDVYQKTPSLEAGFGRPAHQ
jgi:hypothetical protein